VADFKAISARNRLSIAYFGFISRKLFDYVVFADQEELIIDQLKLEAYPTHLVLDKNGNIKKIFNKGSELMAYIDENKSLFQN
tara:strand:- start:899 stop:1147 length:249 start_codon:yes stop_codon:yes gene_type:complete